MRDLWYSFAGADHELQDHMSAVNTADLIEEARKAEENSTKPEASASSIPNTDQLELIIGFNKTGSTEWINGKFCIANIMFGEKNIEACIRHVEDILESSPKDVDVWNRAIQLLIRVGAFTNRIEQVLHDGICCLESKRCVERLGRTWIDFQASIEAGSTSTTYSEIRYILEKRLDTFSKQSSSAAITPEPVRGVRGKSKIVKDGKFYLITDKSGAVLDNENDRRVKNKDGKLLYSTKSLLIKSIQHITTKEDLHELFGECGVIEDMRIFGSHPLSRMACIDFEDTESADKALQLNGSLIHGKPVKVFRANLRAEHFDMKNPQPELYTTESCMVSDDNDKGRLAGKRNGAVLYAGNHWKNKDGKILYSTKSLFIRRVHHITTKEDLLELFGECGAIKDVRIFGSDLSNLSNRIAVIDFEDTESADKALQLNEAFIDGVSVRVSRATLRVRDIDMNDLQTELYTTESDVVSDGNDNDNGRQAEKTNGAVVRDKDGNILFERKRLFLRSADLFTRKEIRQRFGHYGAIVGIKHMNPRNAYIRFADAKSADKALQLDGSVTCGKAIEVSRAKASFYFDCTNNLHTDEYTIGNDDGGNNRNENEAEDTLDATKEYAASTGLNEAENDENGPRVGEKYEHKDNAETWRDSWATFFGFKKDATLMKGDQEGQKATEFHR